MHTDFVLFVCMRRDLFPTALCNAARLGLAATLFPASAFTAFAADSYTIFAPGVSESGGWYDVNKKSTTSQATKDFLFCWGAAASNMAQYWQDCYVKSGHSLPSNVPNGTDSALGYELGIFDVFLYDDNNLEKQKFVLQTEEVENVFWLNKSQICELIDKKLMRESSCLHYLKFIN